MSKHDSNLGSLFTGIAALITAIVGVLIWLGVQPKGERSSDAKPNIQSPSPAAPPKPSIASPGSQAPLDKASPAPGENTVSLTLNKLNEDTRMNALQAKDVYDGVRINISGFVLKNSIEECSIVEEDGTTVKTTRCLILYPSPNGGDRYYAQSLSFDPDDLSPAIKLNQVLFQAKKPLEMTIQGTIAYKTAAQFSIRDWSIVLYQEQQEP
jgi:hypothetical protein